VNKQNTGLSTGAPPSYMSHNPPIEHRHQPHRSVDPILSQSACLPNLFADKSISSRQPTFSVNDTLLTAQFMETAVLVMPMINGVVSANGKPKVKSKNQLRRLKQKQRKTTVSPRQIISNFTHVTIMRPRDSSIRLVIPLPLNA